MFQGFVPFQPQPNKEPSLAHRNQRARLFGVHKIAWLKRRVRNFLSVSPTIRTDMRSVFRTQISLHLDRYQQPSGPCLVIPLKGICKQGSYTHPTHNEAY